MALYFYEALSKEGKKISGYIDASSVQSVKEQLSRQGFFPTEVTQSKSYARFSWVRRLFVRRISMKEKILFTKQLSVLLKSGVPLLQALELLVDHFTGTLGAIVSQVKDDIKEGSSLAKTLSKYPHVFDNIYVQLVRAGEASGKLEVILERLTNYMERREDTARRLRTALRGPAIQLILAIIVVSVLLIYAVPQMVENFASFGQELPGATALLIALSNFIVAHYMKIIIFTGLIGLGFYYWRSTKEGATRIDEIKLRVPIVSYFVRMKAVVQFCHTLGMLTESGVNLAESLDIVCNIVDNKALISSLRDARDKIIKQGKIAQYLKQTGIFPAIATYLIKTGEESGKLDFMLLTVAKNYEEELGEFTEKFAAQLGPILLLVMAAIVGFIVVAMMLPMARMGEMINV